ncbi:phosphoadenosine phosphosulfate reductase family protein (plasmid) [Sutcliffiella horikoshii]|uniref:phosphoadenosine phosphosulfate reductase domain-containing protein n=1 Tax=Sutcliffiella horikoshii TaxID=79883 RepID=UPI001CBF15AC|nr:phosphoadenosine phosphosulfate reductase family protein [Sutcliffiella horikoshii]UAL49877.1 phosphoadenosine phosphosulfate reductase family protein [Sutcliffiella horikoshii]
MSSFYEPFQKIKEEMKDLYLRDNKEIVLATSFGKDSTMVLLLFWEMLLSLAPSDRHKKVHVITSNTEVETPDMHGYLVESIEKLNKVATSSNLPVIGNIAVPNLKDNYWVNILGKGNPPVSPNSRYRWCSSKLKINAVDQIMKAVIAGGMISLGEEYDIILAMGVRMQESIARNASIKKNQLDGDVGKFANHSSYKNVLVYHPIKHLSGDQLWAYIDDYEYFPWGTSVAQLRHFYPEDIFECSLKTDGQGNSCGNGRNGCWTCTAVSEDKMLKNLVQKNSSLTPLLEYKNILAQIRNDARYRMPVKRIELKRTNKRMQQLGNSDNQLDLLGDGFLKSNEESVHDRIRTTEYEGFDRAEEVEYNPGSLTIEARVFLLRKLLYIQEKTGFNLIPKEIVKYIQSIWREEGYSILNISPLNWQYDGPVVYDKFGIMKKEETLNPYPQFWVHQDFDLGRDELIKYIENRVKDTGKSYFFYVDHHDMGEEEQFVWNVGYFLVCDKDIHTYEEALKSVSEWLYEPPKIEEMDYWEAFAKKYEEAAIELSKSPHYNVKLMEQINKVLTTLGRDPYPINSKIESYQLDLFQVS